MLPSTQGTGAGKVLLARVIAEAEPAVQIRWN
ncbi:MAG: hypothetical protein IPG69_04320 [Flavobacteriales bacterium]|nr:hypothetical protein [Flavobacteriales bacterium]